MRPGSLPAGSTMRIGIRLLLHPTTLCVYAPTATAALGVWMGRMLSVRPGFRPAESIMRSGMRYSPARTTRPWHVLLCCQSSRLLSVPATCGVAYVHSNHVVTPDMTRCKAAMQSHCIA